MATTSSDIAKANPTRFGSYLRNAPVSAGFLVDQDWSDLADFLVDLPFGAWESLEDLEDLHRVLDDIEFAGRTSTLKEGLLKTKKASSQKSSYARKWYKANRARLATKRRKLKSNISAISKAKKRERLRKQRKNVKGKPLRQYHTKNH